MAELVPQHDAVPQGAVAFHVPPNIPDHTLLRRIGGGSYGDVWLAQSVLGTYRAVKIVYRRSFNEDRPYEREFNGIKRFEPISRSHEGLVDILQTGRNDDAGYFYYVMELADPCRPGNIEAQTYSPKTIAAERRARGRFSVDETVKTALVLASALSHLHASGLVHRDIKPSNIILVGGVPKLADIGLVAELTEARSYVGSEGFIPPEGPGKAQADIFALGKVIYEIAMGRDRAEYPQFALEVDPVRDEQLFELNEIILRACDDDLVKRYSSADNLLSDVKLLQEGQSVRRLRVLERRFAALRKTTLVASLVITLLGTVGYYTYSTQRQRREARDEKVAAYVARGARLMDEGNLFTALGWFGEALRLDADDPTRSHTHRVRIAALTRQCPQLIASWPTRHHVNFGQCAPDGKLIGTIDGTGVVEIRRLDDLMVPHPAFKHGSAGRTVCFSPDGLLIASVGSDPLVRIWKVSSGEELLPALHHDSQVYSAVFSPDARSMLTACADGSVRVWNLSSRTAVTIMAHRKTIESARYSPDGKRIITASRDRSAQVWNLSGAAGPRLSHGHWVYDAVFSPEGTRIVTASFDRTAIIWDATTGQQLVKLSHDGAVASAEFSPDGQYVVTACWDNTVRLWDAYTGERAFAPLLHAGPVMHACFTAEGKRVLTVSMDKTVRLWDLDESAWTPQALSRTSQIVGRYDLSATNANLYVRAFSSPGGGQSVDTIFAVQDIIANTVGTHAAFIFAENRGQVWDIGQFRPVSPELHFSARPKNLVVNHNGSKLLWCEGEFAHLWNVGADHRIELSIKHPDRVRGAAFDARGRYFATTTGSNVYVWASETARPVGNPLEHDARVTHVEFAHNSDLLVTTCSDNELEPRYAQIWKISDLNIKPLVHLPHGDGVVFATFSPDDRYVATASEDSSARIWNVIDSGRTAVPLQHKDQVKHCQFSPDGQWIATAAIDKTARVWDVKTGTPITPPLVHSDPVVSLAWSSDARTLATQTDNRKWFVWDLAADQRSVDEIVSFAHTFSGSQVTPRQEVRTWSRERGQVRQTYSPPSAGAFEVWHQKQATKAEIQERGFAAAFHLTRLLKDDPNNARLLLRRGTGFAQIGQWTNAITDFEAALREGADPLSVRWQLVRARLACGQEAKGRAECKELLEIATYVKDPFSANLVAWTCSLLSDAIQDTAALVALASHAVATDPQNPLYRKTLGSIYYRTGDFQKAISTLEPIQKSRLEALVFLAMTYSSAGNPEKAQELLTEAEIWYRDTNTNQQEPWYRCIELKLLLAEARSVIDRQGNVEDIER